MRTSILLVLAFSSVAPRAMAQPELLRAVPPPVPPQTAPTPETSEDAVVPRNHGIRPRYGVSVGFFGGGGNSAPWAPVTGNDSVSPAFGGELQGRIGVQFEDHVALFYQGSFAGGREVPFCFRVRSGDSCPPPSDDAIYLHASSLIIDFTFGRGMQIGVGGSAVLAHFDTDRPSTEVRAGYLMRVGYTFGGDGPGVRQGFSMGLQANLSFVVQGESPGPLVDIAISLGWESF